MEHNVITAVIAIVMLGMVARGYVPLLSIKMARWAVWVFVGVIILSLSTFFRQGYWDLAQYVTGARWDDVRAALGGQRISSVFNIGVIVACYAFLKARFLLLPEDEREGWHWWNAWHHPCKTLVLPSFMKRRED